MLQVDRSRQVRTSHVPPCSLSKLITVAVSWRGDVPPVLSNLFLFSLKVFSCPKGQHDNVKHCVYVNEASERSADNRWTLDSLWASMQNNGRCYGYSRECDISPRSFLQFHARHLAYSPRGPRGRMTRTLRSFCFINSPFL